ncbi:MAG TPA: hypothetical protein VNO51_02205 [Ilumatobacteraceae bacterium]|nr:hypothetical protein [Ilumatobacteraceae bacterium]
MEHAREAADHRPAADAVADEIIEDVAGDVVVFPSPPLLATVIVDLVPDIALASLADFVDPVTDDAGRVVDWEFGRTQGYDAADLKAFRVWRDTWERTWDLGPLSNLVALQRIVSGVADVPRVAALLEALVAQPETVRIESSAASDVPAQLDALRAAIVALGREGTAIVDQTPRRRATVGFSRTWGTPAVPELIAADRATVIVIDPADGLVVVERATGARRITDVVEADLRGEVVIVTNDRGETIELEAAAARPLAWLVPASVRWTVRPIPEVVVWSALFVRLPDALSVAAATDGHVSFAVDRDS